MAHNSFIILLEQLAFFIPLLLTGYVAITASLYFYRRLFKKGGLYE